MDVERVIKAFDELLDAIGKPKLSFHIAQMENLYAKVPTESRSVLDTMIKDSIANTVNAMMSVSSDALTKAMSPESLAGYAAALKIELEKDKEEQTVTENK